MKTNTTYEETFDGGHRGLVFTVTADTPYALLDALELVEQSLALAIKRVKIEIEANK